MSEQFSCEQLPRIAIRNAVGCRGAAHVAMCARRASTAIWRSTEGARHCEMCGAAAVHAFPRTFMSRSRVQA
eukprot:11161720-Lingulodinium_polyedra.AAC.1